MQAKTPLLSLPETGFHGYDRDRLDSLAGESLRRERKGCGAEDGGCQWTRPPSRTSPHPVQQ